MSEYGALEILFHPDAYRRLYNCTAYNVDDIPLTARQHPILGSVYIILFFIYMVRSTGIYIGSKIATA